VSLLGWVVALAYPVGNWILWHRVERERRPLPDDAYGDPEPIAALRRPPEEALTPLGWRRWHVANAFTRVGFAAWLVGGTMWFCS
jgi:hypothetical protein